LRFWGDLLVTPRKKAPWHQIRKALLCAGSIWGFFVLATPKIRPLNR
jgi:hypothetical protein